MHILLTDVLTCPRCGPRFGLVVLADRMEGRRVEAGHLGCPNCREEYAVRAGVAELVPSGAAPAEPTGERVQGADRAYRTAALLGAAEAAGMVLVAGGAPDLVAEVARLLPTAEVVAVAPPGAGAEGPVSWIRVPAGVLPFRDRSLFGAALLGGGHEHLLGEVARVLRPGTRVVVDPAAAGVAEELENRGLQPLLDQEGVVVASAPGPR